MKPLNYKGFLIMEAESSKNPLTIKCLSAIQVREPHGKNAFVLKKSITFKTGSKALKEDAVEQAKKYVDDNRRRTR